jgi:hypothetical protein
VGRVGGPGAGACSVKRRCKGAGKGGKKGMGGMGSWAQALGGKEVRV